MARKSRKTHLLSTQTSTTKVQFRVGIYLRLSVKTEDEHNSLESQEGIIRHYLEDKPEFAIVDKYSDYGFTGTNFERPNFKRMMDDVRNGKINCILIKDFSRFARNHIGMGKYLTTILPFLEVRLISVNDSYDSFNKSNSEEIVMHLLNISHSMYAKDISAKIIPSIRGKQERGEYLGPYPNYGYIRNPNDNRKLIVDPESAEVVRLIYKLKLEGNTDCEILKHLNSLDILSPSAYRYRKGITNSKRLENGIWNTHFIRRILRDECYCGHTLSGKIKTSLAHNIKRHSVPKEDWIVVKNTHEAIISEELFQQVKELLEKVNEKYRKQRSHTTQIPVEENLLADLIFCKQCGSKLYRYTFPRYLKDGSKVVDIRFVHINQTSNENPCRVKGILEKNVHKAISAQYKEKMPVYLDFLEKNRLEFSASEKKKEHEKLHLEQKNLFLKLQQVQKRNDDVFDKFIENRLSQEEYQVLRTTYAEQLVNLEKEIAATKKNLELTKQNCAVPSEINAPQNEFVFLEENVQNLIQKVQLTGRNQIHVTFTFEDTSTDDEV